MGSVGGPSHSRAANAALAFAVVAWVATRGCAIGGFRILGGGGAMSKYVVHLELVAVRVAEASGELKAGQDPISAMAAASLKLMNDGPPAMLAGPPPGVTLRKSFPVTAESFAALCELLRRFDELAERGEGQHP